MKIGMQDIKVFFTAWAMLNIKQALPLERQFRVRQTDEEVVGSIGSQQTTATVLQCSMRCLLDAECKAYRYTSSPAENCALIYKNKTAEEGQIFLADLQNHLYKQDFCFLADCPENSACVDDTDSHISQLNCDVDWCPPSDWTSPDMPVYYRSFDTEEGVELMNGAQIVSGKVNNAVSTDCSLSQYVSLGNISSVARIALPDTCGPNGGALSAWIRVNDCGNDGGIISSFGPSTGFQLFCYDTYVSHNVGLTTGYFDVMTTVPSGWFHLVLNFIGPNDGQGVAIYHDGIEVGTDTEKGGVALPPGAGVVVIGRYLPSVDALYASVMMDELLFFNRKLSSDEVQILYNMHQ